VALAGRALPELDLASSLGARLLLFGVYVACVLNFGVLTAEEREQAFGFLRSPLGALRGGAAGAGRP
jgi:hypothetical protein